MTLDRLWELMVWVAPYVLTAYVVLTVLAVARLVWLGFHDRRHHA